jgi:hypothetical protein
MSTNIEAMNETVATPSLTLDPVIENGKVSSFYSNLLRGMGGREIALRTGREGWGTVRMERCQCNGNNIF